MIRRILEAIDESRYDAEHHSSVTRNMRPGSVLTSAEDMAWLAEVHTPIARGYAVAIIYGNDDSPDAVELYARDHYKCKPTVLLSDEDGNLRVAEWGEQPGKKSGVNT